MFDDLSSSAPSGCESSWDDPDEDEIALIQRLNAETASLLDNGLDDDELDEYVPAGQDPFSRLRTPDAEELRSHAAGTDLAFRLGEVDMETVDDYAVVEVVAAWARLTAWAQAGAARAAAELTRREAMVINPRAPVPDDAHPARRAAPRCAAAHEIAMRLLIPRRAAQAMIDLGRAITGPLAPVGDALTDGDIDLPRARAFVDALGGVALPVALEVQDAVLPTAPRRSTTQVRADLAAALIATDPVEATRRHHHARDRRRVCRPTRLPDGMAGIWAVLPAPDAVALDTALDAAARAQHAAGDRRSTDQLRADILASVGHSALSAGWIGAPPTGTGSGGSDAVVRDTGPGDPGQSYRLGAIGGRPAQVRVTVPLAVLLPSVTEQGGRATRATGDGPGSRAPDGGASADEQARAPQVADLDGYGPITPDVARALALGGVWSRLVTDPWSGTVTDIGRTRYHPPPDLADLVRARDRTCTRPGCSARAQSCDLDHTVPYHLGGHTALWNLAALCSADHALKTAGGVRVHRDERGDLGFEMPSGHRYRRHGDGTSNLLPRTDTRRTGRDTEADDDPPPF